MYLKEVVARASLQPNMLTLEWGIEDFLQVDKQLEKGDFLCFLVEESFPYSDLEQYLNNLGYNFVFIIKSKVNVANTNNKIFISSYSLDCIKKITLEQQNIHFIYAWNDMMLVDLALVKQIQLSDAFLVKLLFLIEERSFETVSKVLLLSNNCNGFMNYDKDLSNYGFIVGTLASMRYRFAKSNICCFDIDSVSSSYMYGFILREISSVNYNFEVCIRAGKRFVKKCLPYNISFSKDRFKLDGTVLIAGGLGGIGFEISKWLLKESDVNVVLLGSSSFVEFSNEQQNRLHDLQQIRPGLSYVPCDLLHEKAIKSKLLALKNDIKSVSTVLYLAGSYHELEDLALETEDLDCIHVKSRGLG